MQKTSQDQRNQCRPGSVGAAEPGYAAEPPSITATATGASASGGGRRPEWGRSGGARMFATGRPEVARLEVAPRSGWRARAVYGGGDGTGDGGVSGESRRPTCLCSAVQTILGSKKATLAVRLTPPHLIATPAG